MCILHNSAVTLKSVIKILTIDNEAEISKLLIFLSCTFISSMINWKLKYIFFYDRTLSTKKHICWVWWILILKNFKVLFQVGIFCAPFLANFVLSSYVIKFILNFLSVKFYCFYNKSHLEIQIHSWCILCQWSMFQW